jgi:transposase
MITLDDLWAHLLPPDQHLKFQTLIIDEPRLILVAAMISAKSTCPDCTQPTDRIYGRYRRTLADLPSATAPIELRLIVRRFRCLTCTCRRQTFAERLPTIAPPYARTTTRLATMQAYTGLALGGAAGPWHLSHHGLPVSRNTLLRRVRSLSLPKGPAPQIIGIDDWAWRKGNRYGPAPGAQQRLRGARPAVAERGAGAKRRRAGENGLWNSYPSRGMPEPPPLVSCPGES